MFICSEIHLRFFGLHKVSSTIGLTKSWACIFKNRLETGREFHFSLTFKFFSKAKGAGRGGEGLATAAARFMTLKRGANEQLTRGLEK